MADLFTYLDWRGDLTLSERPLNAVDGVILARAAYFPYARILTPGGRQEMRLADAAQAFAALENLQDVVLRADDVRLIAALGASGRFAELTVGSYADELEAQTQTQFSAVTFRLPDGARVVSFRGTDNTLIGWKEDLNMGVVCPVPAQTLAVSYLESIADSTPDAPLYVVGHSKGGNLAVYAAAFCREGVQARIRTVYNYDGPGFDQTVLAQGGYRRICERVRTYVPQSSVVGMLLGHEEAYTIVHSTQSGLLQHDTYSWEVLPPQGFLCLETVDSSSRFVDLTLKSWLADMSLAQREAFVDAVYGILTETHARTLHEMGEKWFSSAVSMVRSYQNLDDDTRRAVTQALTLLMKSAKTGLTQVLQKPE